jgi:hypothetical protein
MSILDIVFATCAAIAAVILVVKSPWHRAVLKESLFHPRSDGWVDIEADHVYVHRGLSLPDYVLSQTLASLREAQTALEAASREQEARAKNPTSQPPQLVGEGAPWWSYAAIAASVAAVATATAAFLGRDGKPSNEGGAYPRFCFNTPRP